MLAATRSSWSLLRARICRCSVCASAPSARNACRPNRSTNSFRQCRRSAADSANRPSLWPARFRTRAKSISKKPSDGSRPLEVQPPTCAVGEDSPTHPSFRQVVGATQVAEHLRGRRDGLVGAPVQAAQPPLRLDHRRADRVAGMLLAEFGGPALRAIVGEQEPVGHVPAAGGAEILLPQMRRPAQLLQRRPDEVVLGFGLVRAGSPGEALEGLSKAGFDLAQSFVGQIAPGRQFAEGLRIVEKVRGEQAAANGRIGVQRHCERSVSVSAPRTGTACSPPPRSRRGRA